MSDSAVMLFAQVNTMLVLLSLFVVGLALWFRGGRPRLGGLRIMGAGLLFKVVAGVLGWVLSLGIILQLIATALPPGFLRIYHGTGMIFSGLIHAAVVMAVGLGLVKLATDLAAER